MKSFRLLYFADRHKLIVERNDIILGRAQYTTSTHALNEIAFGSIGSEVHEYEHWRFLYA